MGRKGTGHLLQEFNINTNGNNPNLDNNFQQTHGLITIHKVDHTYNFQPSANANKTQEAKSLHQKNSMYIIA